MEKSFYTMDSKLLSSTIQVHVDIKNKGYGWNLIKGDYDGFSFPIIFKQKYGSILKDVLDTGWPSLFLISDKFKDVLEENNLSGWKTFQVKVFDKKGKEILGYHGLSITGRSAPKEYRKSTIFEKRLAPNGTLSKYYKGFHIDVDKWIKAIFS